MRDAQRGIKTSGIFEKKKKTTFLLPQTPRWRAKSFAARYVRDGATKNEQPTERILQKTKKKLQKN